MQNVAQRTDVICSKGVCENSVVRACVEGVLPQSDHASKLARSEASTSRREAIHSRLMNFVKMSHYDTGDKVAIAIL